jgi:predicted nucleotidyltransferase
MPHSLQELVKLKRAEIEQIAARHGAYNVRVFGSVARGEDSPDSDVDFLIDAGPETSSWFPAGLVLDLEALLGRRVEVVTEKALSAYIRAQVLEEAVPL